MNTEKIQNSLYIEWTQKRHLSKYPILCFTDKRLIYIVKNITDWINYSFSQESQLYLIF